MILRVHQTSIEQTIMNNLQVTFQTLAIVLAMSIRTLVPTLVDSDHESDDDPSKVGYNDLDTDKEIDSTAVEERVSRRDIVI